MDQRSNRRSFLRLAGMAAAGAALARRDALALLAAPETPSASPRRILILGAGLAGMAAGLRLIEAGHDIVILEGRSRPGGRVYTVREPFADGLYAEAGAARIPPTHSLTLEYAKRFQFDLDPVYPEKGAKVFLWRGQRAVVPFGRDPITSDFRTNFTEREREAGFGGLDNLYLESVRNEFRAFPFNSWPYPKLEHYGRISLKDYLKSRGASDQAIEILSQGFEGDSVTDYVHDSISHAVPNLWKIRGGNDLLPRAMAKQMRSRIRYGAEAISIQQDSKGVKVAVKGAGLRQEITGDSLICTLPFPVLQKLKVAPDWSPQKKHAIQNLYVGPVVRVFIQTRERFWEKQGLNGFATADRPMEIWSPSFNQPGERGIVMSYLYERMAREYTGLSPDLRIQRTLDLFEQIHPGIREQTEAAASFAWAEEKFSLGAYAVTQPGDFDRIVPFSGVPEGRIHFAGEHTSPWPGWMQGALHSGLRAASEVLHKIGR